MFNLVDTLPMPLELPTPDHTPLTSSPLVQVISQLRFEEHPNTSDPNVAGAFREALGSAADNYPMTQQLVGGQKVTLSIGATGQPVTDTRASMGWRFASKDGTSWAVTLFPDSVGLETTKFAGWDDFSSRAGAVIDALVEIVAPVFEQRLGVRFVNRIEGQHVESPDGWAPLISEYFLGPLLHPGLRTSVRGAQQLLQLDLGEDAFCGLRHALLPATDNPAEFDYLLDFDLYREQGRPFDAGEAKAVLSLYNDYAEQLFQAALKPQFLASLR